MNSGFLDTFHRHIDYLRISVTDLCNLRCSYCTASATPHLTHDDILRYEEIGRVVEAAALLGVTSIRLTGGEPLIRPGVSQLVKIIAAVPGITDISMTTNGILLPEQAGDLKEAGLTRVNISLDTFKPERFASICGVDQLSRVLAGIEAAGMAGLNPVKINTVILRGINDDEILDVANKSLDDGWHVRYIEEMPLVESENGHKMVSIEEIRSIIEKELGELEPCWPTEGRGPAKYYRLPGASGSIGFIAPVTGCFCAECNRFRLTADGRLRPCLLRDDEVDVKTALRNGAGIEEIQQLMLQAAHLKQERHQLGTKVGSMIRQMWQIGG